LVKHSVKVDEETYGMLLLMKNAYSIRQRRNLDMNDVLKPAVKARYAILSDEIRQTPDLFGHFFGFRRRK
jgi:hypothetical protein